MSIPRLSHRDPQRIAFAREQRVQANEFTHDVWQMLRGGRVLGEKFRREHPLGPYTLDFVCTRLKLNIEIDGKDHSTEDGRHHDQRRDAYLHKLGNTVLRIPGFRVTQVPMSVSNEFEAVVRTLRENSPSPPAPLPEAGRGELD